MKSRNAEVKEKEKAEKLKALRKELEAELEGQLSSEEEQSRMHVDVHEADTREPLEDEQALSVIEALLFASSKPLTVAELKKVVKGYTPKQITEKIETLKNLYDESNRSFEIIEIAGGYEIVTRKQFAPWIMKVELQKKVKQATKSALETLAILAYKQPITRAEAEELRGVDVSGVLTTLVDRGFVKIVGKKEVPGRPFLYGTTEKFLDHFGLRDISDLPDISEIRTLVEQSVKKEDLLGKKNIVEVAEEEEKPAEIQEPEEKYALDEINVESIKVPAVKIDRDIPREAQDEPEEKKESGSGPEEIA